MTQYTETPEVTLATFHPSTRHDASHGVLGYVTCTLNNTLKLDNITLRCTTDEELNLAPQERRDVSGCQHPHFQSLNAAASRNLEQAILVAIKPEATKWLNRIAGPRQFRARGES